MRWVHDEVIAIRQFETCSHTTKSWQSTLVLRPWDSRWDEYMIKHSHQTIWNLFTYDKILAIYPCLTTLRFYMKWVHDEAQPSDNLKLVHIRQNLGNLPLSYDPEIPDEMSTSWSIAIGQFETCSHTTKSWQSTLVLRPWDSRWDEYMMKL